MQNRYTKVNEVTGKSDNELYELCKSAGHSFESPAFDKLKSLESREEVDYAVNELEREASKRAASSVRSDEFNRYQAEKKYEEEMKKIERDIEEKKNTFDSYKKYHELLHEERWNTYEFDKNKLISHLYQVNRDEFTIKEFSDEVCNIQLYSDSQEPCVSWALSDEQSIYKKKIELIELVKKEKKLKSAISYSICIFRPFITNDCSDNPTVEYKAEEISFESEFKSLYKQILEWEGKIVKPTEKMVANKIMYKLSDYYTIIEEPSFFRNVSVKNTDDLSLFEGGPLDLSMQNFHIRLNKEKCKLIYERKKREDRREEILDDLKTWCRKYIPPVVIIAGLIILARIIDKNHLFEVIIRKLTFMWQ